MTRIEPRIAERRQRVREEGARGTVRRLLRILALAAALGAVAWFLQSPWMAVGEVEVVGSREARVREALEEAGVGPGTPTVLVWALRGGRLEEILAVDPWVVEAEVRAALPSTVEVWISERTAAARLPVSGGGWVLAASDGMVLATVGDEDLGPVVSIEVAVRPGERVDDPAVLGSMRFLEGLAEDLREGASVHRRDGELWARVGGHEVRLGLPSDMAAKAAALAALLEAGVPEGASLDLLAPTRPALREPSSED